MQVVLIRLFAISAVLLLSAVYADEQAATKVQQQAGAQKKKPVKKGPLDACRSYHCLYRHIVKDREAKFTNESCKSLDGTYTVGPERVDKGMLCRLYIARRKAGLRKKLTCRTAGAINPDYSSRLPSHLLWIYSDAIFSSLPKSLKAVDRLPTEDFNNTSENNVFFLSRRTSLREVVRMKKIIERKSRYKHRKLKPIIKYVTKGNVRKIEFDVYYCVVGVRKPRYLPYFYTLRMTPSITDVKRVRDIDMKKLLTKEYVKMEYLEKPPYMEARILLQLYNKEMKPRYKGYKLLDVNGDGDLDLVFLEDAFRKYRPGVCLYQKGAKACKLVLAKDYSRSSIFFRSPRLEVGKNKRIDIIISDKQYKGNEEKFTYLYKNGVIVKASAADLAAMKKSAKPVKKKNIKKTRKTRARKSRKSRKRKRRKRRRSHRHSPAPPPAAPPPAGF